MLGVISGLVRLVVEVILLSLQIITALLPVMIRAAQVAFRVLRAAVCAAVPVVSGLLQVTAHPLFLKVFQVILIVYILVKFERLADHMIDVAEQGIKDSLSWFQNLIRTVTADAWSG